MSYNEKAYKFSVRDDTSFGVSSGDGADVFVASYYIGTSTGDYTCDKTYAEVEAALAKGPCFFRLTSNMVPGAILNSIWVEEVEDGVKVVFLFRYNGENTFYTVTHTADSIIPGFMS